MKIELLVDNREGEILDISDLVCDLSWKTSRKGKAGSLDIKHMKTEDFTIDNGNIVRFSVDGNNVFYGYVFENSGSRNKDEISLTAYDQIRYLMFNDIYWCTNKRADEIIIQLIKNLGLKSGTIENTKYVIPSINEDNKKVLDIIYSILEKTLMSTGRTYVFYDNFGLLELKDINNMRQQAVISEKSNLQDYDHKTSIDGETFNWIKAVKEDKNTKKREIYTEKDPESLKKWGVLQHYFKPEDNMNKAQIEEMMKNLLKLKNREEKTLKLKGVLGTDIKEDLKLRAGAGVFVEAEGYNKYFLIEDATHNFSKDEHSMDFDLRVV